ncbi:MAG: DNA polymerase III subunit beta [Desulfosoma sp.]|uniref:DNA polymerase III subunit beta n=1 Tax=Desulfosoma sp. TaxID=2603217 RepID=UPI00404A10A2
MKWTVKRDILQAALQKVVGIAEQRRASMQVLSHVLLEATDTNRFSLSATDLSLSVRTNIAAQVECPGQTTVSARKLLESVKEVRHDVLHCELLENERLSVTAGAVNYTLATIPAADFPYFETITPEQTCPLNVESLRRGLESTLYAVPEDEDAISVSGMFWHPVAEDRLRVVSSDGHRLAMNEVPFPSKAFFADVHGVVVPRKGVQEIIRLLEKTDTALGALHENRLIIRTPDTHLMVLLLEETFPKYEVIIPRAVVGSLEVPRAELQAALRRMAVVSDASSNHVRFIISQDRLGLDAGSEEYGTAHEEIPVEYAGENFSIAFNIRYVLDVVQSFTGPMVRLEWVDEYHGGIFRDRDDPGIFALIMPIMV